MSWSVNITGSSDTIGKEFDKTRDSFAREAGISRQHLRRIRTGVADPTRPIIRDLTIAAQRLLHRHVRAQELFELGDD